jgi:hypothetical protein
LLGGHGLDTIDAGDGDDTITGGNGRDDFADDEGPRGRGRDDAADCGPDENDDDEHIPPSHIPPAVLAAFNARDAGVTIREVEHELEDEGVVIKIEFIANGQRRRAEFTEAGQFIEEENRG